MIYMCNFPYKRVLIVGCGGAGKSTLAIEMSRIFSLPVVHLDKIGWLPNWQSRAADEFDALLDIELNKSSWIIDGNYRRTFSHRLKFADFCIFLDYSKEICINSVHERRSKYSGTTRPDMTADCEEIIDDEFIEWINSYKKTIRPKMIKSLKKSSVPYKIFTTREETTKWLNTFK